MDWLEEELKQALERKEPSPGFEARIAEAVRQESAEDRARWLPRWLPAAAAIAVIAAGGGAAYRHHQGTVAKDQVMLAMRITAGTLNHIQSHVRESRQ